MSLVWLEKNKITIIDALNKGTILNKAAFDESVRKNRLVSKQPIAVLLS